MKRPEDFEAMAGSGVIKIAEAIAGLKELQKQYKEIQSEIDITQELEAIKSNLEDLIKTIEEVRP